MHHHPISNYLHTRVSIERRQRFTIQSRGPLAPLRTLRYVGPHAHSAPRAHRCTITQSATTFTPAFRSSAANTSLFSRGGPSPRSARSATWDPTPTPLRVLIDAPSPNQQLHSHPRFDRAPPTLHYLVAGAPRPAPHAPLRGTPRPLRSACS